MAATDGVVGAYVPIYITKAIRFGLGLQFFHNTASAVFPAYRVGAAAGKTQNVHLRIAHIRRQLFAQFSKVLPEGLGAGINFAVPVAAAVQGNQMAFAGRARQHGQIFLVIFGRYDKKGGRHALFFQNIQNIPGHLAGAIVKGEVYHLFLPGAAIICIGFLFHRLHEIYQVFIAAQCLGLAVRHNGAGDYRRCHNPCQKPQLAKIPFSCEHHISPPFSILRNFAVPRILYL